MIIPKNPSVSPPNILNIRYNSAEAKVYSDLLNIAE